MGGTVISGHGENESDAARHDSAERYVSCRTGRVQTERHAHERQFFARSARCPGEADVRRVGTSVLFPGSRGWRSILRGNSCAGMRCA